MIQKYLNIIKRQEEASHAVDQKYSLLCDAQVKLGSLYNNDPLFASILSKTKNMTEAEMIKFLLSPENDFKSSNRYSESLELINILSKAEIDYYDALFMYIKMVDDDRNEMFSEDYLNRMDELAENGYFLYFLQTPDYPSEWLNHQYWERIFVDYFENTIDYLFAEILKTGLSSTNELQKKKAKALYNAIAFFKNEQYDTCAKELFALLENDYNNADNLNSIRRKGYQKTENIKDKVTSLGYKYFIKAFDKISKFYKLITVNTDKWDKKEVNRNALMHGIYDRDTKKSDCVKLFTLFVSFKEITHYIQRIDDLLEHLRKIKIIIPEFLNTNNIDEN